MKNKTLLLSIILLTLMSGIILRPTSYRLIDSDYDWISVNDSFAVK